MTQPVAASRFPTWDHPRRTNVTYGQTGNCLQAFYGEGNVVLNKFGVNPKAPKKQREGRVTPASRG